MKYFFKWKGHLLLCCFALLGGLACRKPAIKYTTTNVVNIVDYMRQYPSQFSDFLAILDRTNISPFLNAYGAYTCFAPTNAAFALYLKQIGKATVNDIDTGTMRKICQFHLIEDTLSTISFTDGKMPTPTMYGQYLITSVDDAGNTIVNRQAEITQPNIVTGNGYIQVIDHVLQPATQTIAQMVAANSSYTIFTQALQATGLYDTLNINNNPDTTRRWLTFLAESDSILKLSGINSYADLANKYDNEHNPRDPNDSLFLYMAYHILTGINYLADIVSTASHPTLAPQNVVTSLLDGQTILLNQATFNGVLEPGIPMNRAASDNSATNGALHDLSGDIYMKIRTPVGVYWDVADQPEIRKLTSVFRRAGKTSLFAYGTLAGITWQNTTYSIQYTCEAATTSNWYYWDDHLDFNLRATSNTNNWIEFTTPLIVKGLYKVWLCVRKSTLGGHVQASFDGNPLPNIVDFTQYYPSTTSTDAVVEAEGYKRYDSVPASNTTQYAVLAGVVNVPTTDVHKLRLTSIKDQGSGSAAGVTFDMIEFIPVNDDQQYPRFKRDGTEQTQAH